jgi:Pentapeptide repeats (8 copies)
MQHSDLYHLNYADRDWRNRSFRRQNLAGANFRGADLRGCDFSDANLSGADFTGAKLGSTPKQRVTIWAIAVAVAAMEIEAILQTGFGALGQTPGDPAWSYTIALLVTWGISGAGSAARAMLLPKMGSIAETISAVASGAFLGFFYAGVATGKNAPAAIVGAVVGGILALVGTVRFRRRLMWKMAVAKAGAFHGYGFALLIGTQALDRWVVGLFLGGIVWGCISIIYLFFTVRSFGLAVKIARQAMGTLFRNVDLSEARFSEKSY